MSLFDALLGKKQDTTVLIKKGGHEVDGKMSEIYSKFTDEEWALIMFLPVDIYYLVATADDSLDHEVTVMFGKLLDGASTLPNKLLAVLVGDVASGGLVDLLKIVSSECQREKSARMARTKVVLKNKLSPDQYQRFLGLVLVMGQQMAKAAEGDVGSRKKQALITFADHYEVDPQSAFACTCPAGSTAPTANTTFWTAQG